MENRVNAPKDVIGLFEDNVRENYGGIGYFRVRFDRRKITGTEGNQEESGEY